MINRKHRILACLLLCAMLFSVLVVPISHSKERPNYLKDAWTVLTAALDVLQAIDLLIAILVKDVQKMEDAVARMNDELNDDLYPARDKREEDIREVEKKLNKLNAEHAAAESKKSNAESRISNLKSEIKQAEASLAMLSPWESSEREALEHHISMLKSSLKSAEQDVKDANKILNSLWRSAKRAFYESVLGDAFSGLRGELATIQSRISILEGSTDELNSAIKNKNEEIKAEGERRKQAQEDVDQKRADYDKKKKQGDPKDEK